MLFWIRPGVGKVPRGLGSTLPILGIVIVVVIYWKFIFYKSNYSPILDSIIFDILGYIPRTWVLGPLRVGGDHDDQPKHTKHVPQSSKPCVEPQETPQRALRTLEARSLERDPSPK